MKKNFILDTNVLILDENAMFKFDDNNVFIPIAVLNELNYLKEDNRNKETASSARSANKIIRNMLESDKIIEQNEPIKSLMYKGDNGESIYFINNYQVELFKEEMKKDISDYQIILTATLIKDIYKDIKTVLVTNDNGMANRAMAEFRLDVEEYKNQIIDKIYKGRRDITNVDPEILGKIKDGEAVLADDILLNAPLYENEYLCMYGINGDFVAAQYNHKLIKRIERENTKVDNFSVYPKNIGQNFAIDALTSNKPLTIIEGPAGTGKTYLALAVAFNKLLQGEYKQILLLRPNVMLDHNNAALPGNEQKKIDPLMRPYWDNMERLLESYNKGNNEKITIDYLIENKKIKTESFSYIRGRSIDNTFIICDESQNLLRKHIIGLMTRPSDSSKLVILGDSSEEQIDNPYINQYNNGLIYAMNLMKDSPYSSQIAFTEKESKRSELVKDVLKRVNIH